MDRIRHEGCTPVGQIAAQLQGSGLLVWVNYLSTFSRSGGLECHLIGDMSKSVLRVFNLSIVRWQTLV